MSVDVELEFEFEFELEDVAGFTAICSNSGSTTLLRDGTMTRLAAQWFVAAAVACPAAP
jgi:hypothetical protein